MYQPIRTLILDNIRSAHNVGALFRTADGAGFGMLYLVGITPRPAKGELYLSDAEKTLQKTALGAEKALPWRHIKTLPPLLKRLRKEGYELIVLEQATGSIDYRHWKPQGSKVALIVGNEVDGVNDRTLALCDKIIELPMRGKKNSLNVSVAAGIAMYQLSATMEKHTKRM